MSLRRRMTLVSAAAVAVAIVLASVIAFVVARDQLRDQLDNGLRELVGGATVELAPIRPDKPFEHRSSGKVRRRFVPAPAPARVTPAPVAPTEVPLEGPEKRDQFLALPAPPIGGVTAYTQLVREDGSVLQPRDTRGRLPVSERAHEVARGTAEPFFEDATIEGEHVRVLTTALAPGEAIQAARSLEELDRSLRNLALILGGVSFGGICLAGLLGLLVARAAVRPVADLTDAAEHVAETRDLSRRIRARGEGELSRLATAFNTMLEALDESLGSQRQLVADASHELRTPLTSLRTNLELLSRNGALSVADRQRALDEGVQQLSELTTLVRDLIELARGAEPESVVEDVRLDLLVLEAVERSRVHASGVGFRTEVAPCVVTGVVSQLDRAIANLLDNASHWTPTGSDVTVTVREGEVTVRDQGPGISKTDVPHIFDRFYRAPSARGTPGSGLGLAIVRKIVEAHGGIVSAETAPGGGALLRLRLPRRHDGP